jgi:diaminohydroxyphosphoribosylaminopyrimidine deaminase/5-amino-6-(5-phosphoribosylamino)uracil reductase
MRTALALAMKGMGTTSPNPVVGALVVKNGRIVGRGYHKYAGGPHAEVIALSQSGKKVKGATLYVTLEPCVHHGRTPPCTESILKSGIREVVVAMVDPNPLNRGKGIRRLRAKGIKVTAGVMEKQASRMNEVFRKYITERMPFVTVKVAQTLDGKIATRIGESRWITGEQARKYVQKLRSQVDAILVGVGTVRMDNPLLSVRMGYNSKKKELGRRHPARIIVDSKLRTPLGARIFQDNSPAPVIIATTGAAPKRKMWKIAQLGAKILVVRSQRNRVDLKTLMKKLAEMEITSVLIEGGGEVIASAFEEGIVDKIMFFIAPKIIGGRRAKTSVEGDGRKILKNAIAIQDTGVKRFGSDLLVSGYVAK